MKQAVIHCAILLLYALIACALLSPLPLYISEGLLAAESGDPLLQSWVLQWNIHKLSTSLPTYFDANIFYPYSNTFAYHDHLFGLGLLGLPIHFISHNPLLTYNTLLLLSFVLSAYGMFLLCREITQNLSAAWLGGLIFGFLPFRFAHLDHLNLLSVYWLPLCFLFLTRYFWPNVKHARNVFLTVPLFWLCYFLQALTSFNYLFLSAIALSVYGIILALRQWRLGAQPWRGHVTRDLLVFFAGAGFVALSLLPLVLPYLQANKSMGFERTVQETVDLSARLQDYAVAPEHNFLYGSVTKAWQSPTSPYPREQVLFPGILTTLLAAVGIFYGRKGKKDPGCHSARIGFGSVLFVAFLLSLGPFWHIFDQRVPLPYSWLYHTLPGFKSMRVPARFGLLVAFSLAVLASIGVMELYRRWNQRKPQKLRQHLVTLLLGSVILLESYSPFSTLSFYPGKAGSIPEVYQWLRTQPDPLRIVELPILSAQDNFEAMYYSTFHWKALLNGRSAFIPDGIHRAFVELESFPSQRSVQLLQSLAIDYAILHTQKLTTPFPETLPAGLTLVQRFGGDWLIKIETAPHAPKAPEKEKSTPISVRVHLSPSLQQSEKYTMGLELATSRTASFSPLPEESSEVQIRWEKNGILSSPKSDKLELPLLFTVGEQHILPLHFTTPDEPGDYLLHIDFQSDSIAPNKLSKALTLHPELADSRSPNKLRAEYLWADIPEEWPQGRPLPIRMLVKNSGDTLWKAYIENREFPEGETRLAVVDWYELSSGEALIRQRGMELGARGVLRYDLPPGAEASIETEIPTPNIAGEFLLELDMLSEHVEWFSPDRSQTFKKTIYLK